MTWAWRLRRDGFRLATPSYMWGTVVEYVAVLREVWLGGDALWRLGARGLYDELMRRDAGLIACHFAAEVGLFGPADPARADAELDAALARKVTQIAREG